MSATMDAKSETRANYDRLSRWYDLFAGSSERKYIREGLDALRIRHGDKVLEVGPGTGYALDLIRRCAGAGGLACGIDLSHGMAKCAQRRLRRPAPGAFAGLCVGDGSALPLAARTFDSLFLSFTLELFPESELPRVLNESRRILRPGGRLGVVAMLQTPEANWITRMYDRAHARFPRLVDCRPIPLRTLLEQNGFTISYWSERRMWGLAVVIATAAPTPPA